MYLTKNVTQSTYMLLKYKSITTITKNFNRKKFLKITILYIQLHVTNRQLASVVKSNIIAYVYSLSKL